MFHGAQIDMTEHRVDGPGQTSCSSSDPEQKLETVARDPNSGLPSKLRRHGNRVASALRSLTNSASKRLVTVEQQPDTASGGSRTKSIISSGITRMSNVMVRAPMEPTIIHKALPKARPSLKGTFHAGGTLSSTGSTPKAPHTPDSDSTSSKTRSTKSSFTKAGQPSTGKTSLESAPKDKDPKNSASPEQPSSPRHSPSRVESCPKTNAKNTTRSSRESNLDAIQEAPAATRSPSIVTVENAAAAKIYLEIYFNQLLASRPSPRQIRQQLLETDLFHRARRRGSPLMSTKIHVARSQFCRRESDFLRELRVLKTRNLKALSAGGTKESGDLANGYETIKSLGKGSFGVVKLVRESESRRVYAMKVIRKSKMLRSSQEGHLRAERDILVASEGSRWIVPLVASFQDLSNLYLVMEYMPGGDFLGLLIRENTLHETVARFYIAEIILCVEAAHSLKCIHRDIKPDNFLISASGHLKISDFGLAFDGHWSHDTAYHSSHR
ncbi:hypothetical protein VTK26DRAFT_4852 [Humicola hyalothermophila]